MALSVGDTIPNTKLMTFTAEGLKPVESGDVLGKGKVVLFGVPGAFTPTEIYTAHSLGADIVKIFPAVRFGPDYLRAVRGPLPHIPIMPTSGVDASNVGEWFRAGAVAVGAVSSVLDSVLIQNGDWTELTNRAREFMTAVRAAR